MACQHRVRRCRLRGSVSLHIIVICNRLQVLVPDCLAVWHVMSESPIKRLFELLRFPACLRMVNCGEKVFGAQYSVCRVKKLGGELFLGTG